LFNQNLYFTKSEEKIKQKKTCSNVQKAMIKMFSTNYSKDKGWGKRNSGVQGWRKWNSGLQGWGKRNSGVQG
jgi:hypothetical protein